MVLLDPPRRDSSGSTLVGSLAEPATYRYRQRLGNIQRKSRHTTTMSSPITSRSRLTEILLRAVTPLIGWGSSVTLFARLVASLP